MSQPTAAQMLLAPIQSEMREVETIIQKELASDVQAMQAIGEHITKAGGKRMRPALLILMAKTLGYEGPLAAYLGATIELLHTATLMHDDVVDESALRRGQPTANALWGNGVAVLVGDFLYTRSFQMMIRTKNLRVMESLADAANRLSEGEVIQMRNAHNPELDEEGYFAVIERKTACLFAAAANMACAIADVEGEKQTNMVEYALALGNAFQIADDILDYQGDIATMGKNLGGDLAEGKMTLPLIYARQLASDEERAMIDDAIRSGNGDFEAIVNVVQRTKACERALERAHQELERGVKALSHFAQTPYNLSLQGLLRYTVTRTV